MRYDSLAFDAVERLTSCQTVEGVLAELKKNAREIGFDYFLMTGLPLPTQPLQPLVMLNAWPRRWFDRYTREGYFEADGVAQWALRTTEPFLWSSVPAPYATGKRAQQIMDEAKDCGMADGYVVPMYSSTHWQAAITFGSDVRCDQPKRGLAAMHLIAIYAYGRARRLLGDAAESRRILSRREAECLTWIAAGKTTEDIGTILGLSPLTVATHLRNTRAKLQVASIAQAVAEAIGRGEIRL